MTTDLKFALRQLTKSPGFTAIALLTLALGIGLNTSMFSFMNLLILKPLPFPQRDQLVRIHRTTPQVQNAAHSASDFLDLQREVESFATIAAFRNWGYTLTPEGRPSVNLNAIRVSANFFPTLGLKPEVGRYFTPDEDHPNNHVIMLSHDVWQAHFGGDPDIVGRTVRIDGESTTVVGVVPAAFTSLFLWGPTDAFRPLALTDAEKQKLGEAEHSLIARRHANLTSEQFDVRLTTVAERLAQTRPKERSKDGLRAVSLDESAKAPALVGISWMLVSLAAFVLLIACGNLANLQLARSIARSHEFAIRAALGASRSRLLRPLLAESALLSVGGGLLGVLVSVWSNDWISSRLSDNGIFKLTLVLDWRVLSFAVGVSVATALFFGLVPAWLMTKVRVNDSLKSGTRGNIGDRAQHRLRNGLIIVQFGLALVLLAGASLFVRGLHHMVSLDPGWNHRSILQAVLNLPEAKYSGVQAYSFYRQLQERLEALPGVEDATVGWTLPVFQFLTSRTFVVEGKDPPAPGREPVAYVNAVTPSFLSTLQIKLQSGRNFTEADNPSSLQVAMINASMARTLFPNENPIGRRIGSPDPKQPGWFEIVGVVPDIGFVIGGVPSMSPFQVLRPLAQDPWNYVTVAIRTAAPEAFTESMRQTIASLDPDLALQQFGTIKQVGKVVTGMMSMVNSLLISFALLGLFLAALGIYGVVAHLVVQRTPEIGVRVALGAQTHNVVWLILRSGLRLTLWGTGLGLLGSFGLGLLLTRALPTVKVDDPWLLGVVTLILIAIGLLACWLPARRASRVDPMIALRAQ
jgi:putative ABC transport system permease protein